MDEVVSLLPLQICHGHLIEKERSITWFASSLEGDESNFLFLDMDISNINLQSRLGEPYIVNIRELFLARQYILQYAVLIYRNDCNMRVAHIAIYCIFKYFAIYCQYIAIYCILQQYIVYCDNIQNIATIFSISRQYIAIYRNTSRIHRDVV